MPPVPERSPAARPGAAPVAPADAAAHRGRGKRTTAAARGGGGSSSAVGEDRASKPDQGQQDGGAGAEPEAERRRQEQLRAAALRLAASPLDASRRARAWGAAVARRADGAARALGLLGGPVRLSPQGLERLAAAAGSDTAGGCKAAIGARGPLYGGPKDPSSPADVEAYGRAACDLLDLVDSAADARQIASRMYIGLQVRAAMCVARLRACVCVRVWGGVGVGVGVSARARARCVCAGSRERLSTTLAHMRAALGFMVTLC